MMSTPWDTPDIEDDQASRGRSAPTLVSMHFIRSALRRRWLVCVMSGVAGLLVAAAFLMTFPALHEAKATLVLTHQSGGDSSRAAATDVSLLKTRTLATQAVANLGQTMSPDDFLKTVTVESISDDLLTVSLTAPSDAEAVRRLEVLTSLYLNFRGEQLSLQSNLYVQGLQQRIAKLQGEVADQSQRIDQLSAGSPDNSKLSDAISVRAYVQSQIDTLQQQVEDVTLETSSIVSSSRVVDPAASEPLAAKRRIALALASGLIGGAALGCGAVLFFAITSDRLRRRGDIAAALEVPVPVSVGRVTPVSQRWLWLPYLRRLNGRRSNERQRLARAIEMELPTPRRSGSLAVVCLDNGAEVGFAVANAAMNLSTDGCSVAVLDLSKEGRLSSQAVSTMMGSEARPILLRPKVVPTLADRPEDFVVIGEDKENTPSLDGIDVLLTLADFDPSIGADYLSTWTDRVMIAVTSGRSSAEIVRTAADLVWTAGLELRLAALLHTERTDNSSGTTGFDRAVSGRLVDAHERPALASMFLDTEEAVVGGSTETQTAAAPTVDEELTSDEEHIAAEEVGVLEEELTEEESTTDEKQPTVLEELTHEALVAEEEAPVEAQVPEAPAAVLEEQASDEEQAAVLEKQPSDEEAPVADEEEAGATADEQTAGLEKPSPKERPAAILNEAFVQEGPATILIQRTDNDPATDDRPAAVPGEAFARDLTSLEGQITEPAADVQDKTSEELAPDAEKQITPAPIHAQEPITAQELSPPEERDAEQLIPDQEEQALTASTRNEELTSDEEQSPKEKDVPDELIIEDDQTIQMAVVNREAAEFHGKPVTHQDEDAVEAAPLADFALDGDPTVLMQPVDLEEAIELVRRAAAEAQLAKSVKEEEGGEKSVDVNNRADIRPRPENEFDWNWDWPGDRHSEEDADVSPRGVDDQEEPFREPDDIPFVYLADTPADGWVLYLDVYPAASGLSSAVTLNGNWQWDEATSENGSEIGLITHASTASGGSHEVAGAANGHEYNSHEAGDDRQENDDSGDSAREPHRTTTSRAESKRVRMWPSGKVSSPDRRS
jgi:hypothetical protein